ncbi:MAG: SIR2 family NAD-dependent protein deacylase [Tepidiformaceae bacterium]
MHPSQAITQQIHAAAELLSHAQRAVALTGAGLSAESGIPTYRGTDGIWTRFSEPTIDGWELFTRDPAAWWEEAMQRADEGSDFSRAMDDASPNAGHLALAGLEQAGRLQHVITQNIDNLHTLAGSLAVTEIHGNRNRVRCMSCGQREPAINVRRAPLPPLCIECGGILKSDVVMFGEPIPHDAIQECYRQAARADLFLTIGTSAVVYPAADFPIMAKRHGAPLIEINPDSTPLSEIADVIIRAPAGEALPEIARLVRA